MLGLQRIFGINSRAHENVDYNYFFDSSIAKCLNLFNGSLEEAMAVAEESNGFLLLLFHDPNNADSRDFFENILSEQVLLEFLSDMSFKRLITVVLDISINSNYQIALMFGLKFCPAIVVKIKLQSKFQTVMSYEGYIEANQLCGAFQSVLLASEAEYAQSEELKATRSLQSQQDEAYHRSVEADLQKRKSKSILPVDSSPSGAVVGTLIEEVDQKLANRVREAKVLWSNQANIEPFYRIQFLLPDGSKTVASFGSQCTSQDLFNFLFASELLSSPDVAIRSIEPVFEIKDFSNDNFNLSGVENLGKNFKLFVEYY